MPLSSRLRHSVDILLFNPPYVPTISDEAHDAQSVADIQGSWAGGADGMEITDVFLNTVEVSRRRKIIGVYHQLSHQSLLSANGRFYLVAVKDNDIPGIQARMLDQHGLHSEVSLLVFVAVVDLDPHFGRLSFNAGLAANIFLC